MALLDELRKKMEEYITLNKVELGLQDPAEWVSRIRF